MIFYRVFIRVCAHVYIQYIPILVLEVRGRDVGDDSSGRVSESVILRIV